MWRGRSAFFVSFGDPQFYKSIFHFKWKKKLLKSWKRRYKLLELCVPNVHRPSAPCSPHKPNSILWWNICLRSLEENLLISLQIVTIFILVQCWKEMGIFALGTDKVYKNTKIFLKLTVPWTPLYNTPAACVWGKGCYFLQTGTFLVLSNTYNMAYTFLGLFNTYTNMAYTI